MTTPYPTPVEAHWIAPEFQFGTGETLRALRLHYTTIGAPSGDPVLVLHGTGGSARAMLTPGFAGELFGSGQPLDASRYFIIIPDALGAGQSARPSDGLRAGFPRYDYDDMVLAQYRLLTEGLGIRHLRLVLGNSMGGMHAWQWGVRYPGFMDALVPLAAQPTEMAARNWMLRRMLIELIRRDPGYHGGGYTAQPANLKLASVFFGIATHGGTLAYQTLAPTRSLADAYVDEQLAAPFTADANDVIYQWDAARDYNPAPALSRIEAPVLAIIPADDERNPPETGVMERAMRRVRNGRLHFIPASDETRGHSTTMLARFYSDLLRDLLASAPRRNR